MLLACVPPRFGSLASVANRSTSVIVHGSIISLSWQESLFTLLVIYLEKPGKSISSLSVLKDSLQRNGRVLPPATEGQNLLFLSTGIASSFCILNMT